MNQRQHYVPEVYLKRFSINNTGDFFNLKIKSKYTNKSVTTVNKSQVCYEVNRYKINNIKDFELKGITDEYYLEQNTFLYENKELQTLFDILDFREKLFLSQAEKFLKILFSIKRRNPAFSNLFKFENIKEHFERELENLKKETINYKGKIDNIEEVVKKIEHEFRHKIVDEKYSTDLYKHVLIDISENKYRDEEVRVQQFLNLKFHIYQTEYSYPFITSDNPGFTMNSKGEVFNTNLNYVQRFVFPLSPKSLFVLDARQNDVSDTIYKDIYYKKLTPEEVNSFNLGTAFNSNERIFSTSKESLFIIKELIERNTT